MKPRRRRALKKMKRLIPLLALLLAAAPYAFLHPVWVEGSSMEPTLSHGEMRFVLRAWCAGKPHRGEIWVVRRPNGDSVVKRVVGEPWQRVQLQGGRVWINGAYFKEPYLDDPGSSTGMWDTGTGYFDLGDNRGRSLDGRAWGPIARSAFDGKLLSL